MRHAMVVVLLGVSGSLAFAQTQPTKATKEEKTRQELLRYNSKQLRQRFFYRFHSHDLHTQQAFQA